MFGIILVALFTLMHLYLFLRLGSLPVLQRGKRRRTVLWGGLVLWLLFFLGQVLGRGGSGFIASAAEFFAMTWLGLLFLTTTLLAVELVTLGGWLRPRLATTLRGWALVLGLALAVIALIQGLRSPTVVPYEVELAGLPPALDGTIVVGLSDLHLGNQLGASWLTARLAQVEELKPDLVVLLGDIFEGHGQPEAEVMTVLRQFSAPLGVWAVPGNHEFYGGNKLGLFAQANIKLLNNQWAEVRPGLILAGVEDLTTRRRNGWPEGDPLGRTLAGRPPGATILLSHTPWQYEKAAAAGVGLMLSGHTHGGQIYPFGYLVRRVYPLLAGRYQVAGMTAIVCRGTGTWGPRMRLWPRGEILLVTLRAPGVK